MTKIALKNTVISGVLWNSLEKISVKLGQFAVGIVLARLLVPSDFGLIGMLTIFIAISQSFVESGMWSGLIQYQDRSDVDFSTVFIFNFSVSILFYLILFFSAPLISQFFSTPELTPIARVVGLNIIINSISIVQRSRLNISYNFKQLAKVNSLSVIISGIVSIIFAMAGFGVWSLVIRQIIHSGVSAFMLWFYSTWKLSLIFSRTSFNRLFGYGSKLLMAGIYAKIINNSFNMVIGKYYSVGELGFYTQAKTLASLSSDTVSSILKQVTFPILAALQHDPDQMIHVHKRLVRMTAFVVFPVMLTFATLSQPFVLQLLGSKWIPMIPLLQWMCFSKLLHPLSAINLNLLNANGRSDLFLKVELLKAPIIIASLFFTLPYGVEMIVIGQVVISIIFFFVDTFIPGRIYGYTTLDQIKDILPTLLVSIASALATYIIIAFTDPLFLKLIAGIATSIVLYISLNLVVKSNELIEFQLLVKRLSQQYHGFDSVFGGNEKK
jgi:teichuronic acid exporter